MGVNSERVHKWRKNAKLKLIQAFGGKCAICSYDKCIEAFDFHHLDPSMKETYWGKINGSIRSWEYICSEMTKCVMLCSRCHREVHANVVQVPRDAQRLDQSLISKELLYVHEPRKVKQRLDRYEGHDVAALYDQMKNYEAVGTLFGVTGAAIKRKIQYTKKNIEL